MPVPAGVVAPVPTPFAGDGRLELGLLERHLAWLEQGGAGGALVLGSNGEFPSLTLEERREAAWCAAAARGRLGLILNVGSCALGEVEALLETAGRSGYDAVLCPPPYYLPAPPPEGLAAFFARVLEASPVPVLLYNVPAATGIRLTTGLLERLGSHPALAGVKDSSGDPESLERFCGWFSDRGAVFAGNDRLVRRCRDLGGRGVITATANVAPALVRAVWEGRVDQEKLSSVRTLLEAGGLVPSVKAVLARWGLGSRVVRPPLVELDAGTARELTGRLAAAGVHGPPPQGGPGVQ